MLKGQKGVQAHEALRMDELIKRGFIPNRGIAIDGGAHVGSWTVKMADIFDTVYVFEPCVQSFEFLQDNCKKYDNVLLFNCALYDYNTRVDVVPPKPKAKALTARIVKERKKGEIQARTIDGLDLIGCDFIKLDLEGCEKRALIGAKETINKFKPFLVIEFNKNTEGLLELIYSYGYEQVWRNGVDRGFKWKNR